MMTKTEFDTRFGQLTNNDETANLAYGLYEGNLAHRHYLTRNGGAWWFLEKTVDITTVAAQDGYIIPNDVRKIVDLYVTVGTTVYRPLPVSSATMWSSILQGQLGTSDRALYYYRDRNKVYIQPITSSAGSTITIRYRQNVIDVYADDYTAGTLTLTNDDATVTGAGTTFTAAMVGRKLRSVDGDYQWYDIASFTSATALELVAPYEGLTIAGANYTISDSFLLPEAYQDLPLLRAVGRYFMKNDNLAKAKAYFADADVIYDAMLEEAGSTTEGAYISPIKNMVFRDPNIPEPLVNTSNFT